MEILFILGTVLALVALTPFVNHARRLGIVNFAGHLLIALASLKIVHSMITAKSAIAVGGFFYIDALSAFFLLTISIVDAAAALYSIDYMAADLAQNTISLRKVKTYYALFNIFSFSMFLVVVLNNLGLVWVAIEMTTLASAFLVGFHNDKPSIEAAWKYIVICSVGITLALFGTILFYYAASVQGGSRTLNWTDMISVASRLDPRLVKTAFLFILVGYGTKAGLVPMHTWLPDAHSQALSPISALLSGVLLKTAIYAILRFAVIVNRCASSSYTSDLLIFFGLLSLAVSAGFILAQKDLKRLLAYSSIEHIGIVCIGLGVGGVMGLYGALLHIFNHAMTKSIMFFGAGKIVKKYGTNNMNMIRGVIGAMPFVGCAVMIATFALVGSPPFSIFLSEIIIIIAAFTKGAYFTSILLLFFIAVIFGGIVFHMTKIIFGRRPEKMAVSGEPLSGKCVFVVLLVLICVMGLRVPALLNGILVSAIEILKGA
ncbi:MAG: hydrogenase 4 subunit F [Candidatus Omnitrophica bacterium]|nr:hydrogenase 4 subunit F [Candidatus Omnitrophota bacterium]